MSFDWSIKFADFAIIFATLAGPIFAVWASEWRQAKKSELERREWVFRTLMATRGMRLSSDHVLALNHIQFAFVKKVFPNIEDTRLLYLKHLQSPDAFAPDEAIRRAWFHKSNELFADLLVTMTQALRLPFARAEITDQPFRPDAHVITENELNEIRTLLLHVLKFGRPLNIRVVGDVSDA